MGARMNKSATEEKERKRDCCCVVYILVWIIHTDSRIIHLSRRKRNYDGRVAATLKSASRRNAEAETATHRIKEIRRVYYFTSPGGAHASSLPRSGRASTVPSV